MVFFTPYPPSPLVCPKWASTCPYNMTCSNICELVKVLGGQLVDSEE